jgi:peroxiredoxin
MAEFHGTPVVILFYLGGQCLHCVQQLSGFARCAERFSEAGIQIVAIGTDSVEQIKKVQTQNATAFPFPLLADPAWNVFKEWRAHDDFESKPLHGTFFVDASGYLRWQEIGHEPFLDPEFLLEEAKRLLRFDVRAHLARAGSPEPR